MWNTWPMRQSVLPKSFWLNVTAASHSLRAMPSAMYKCVWPCGHRCLCIGCGGIRAFASKKVLVKHPAQQVVSSVRNNNNRAQSRALQVIGAAKHWRHFRKETPLTLTLHKRHEHLVPVIWVPRPFSARNNYYQQASALIGRLVLVWYIWFVGVRIFTRTELDLFLKTSFILTLW